MGAEKEDDIIIIEDNEAAKYDNEQENSINEENLEKEPDSKKIIFIAIIFILIVLIIAMATVIIIKKNRQNKHKEASLSPIEKKLDEKKKKPVEISKLENMIAKANYMYSTGSKEEALNLYEQIAIYSEAISQYNLGVAQLKNKQYKLAQKTFQNAINIDENRCVSAINAAVCSLYLNDQENFNYYIDLAYAYLPNEINSPLYSYYYTLINYYKNNYFEALSSLKHRSSDKYQEKQKYLSTKINALFNNNLKAIEELETNFTPMDSFNLALLYSRVGDYPLAIKNFEEALINNIQPEKTQFALGLINLKAGHIQEATKNIKAVTTKFPDDVYKNYPIKVFLKPSLFDEKLAQKHYRDITDSSKELQYQKIFYFAPYKVFNANKTISYIRKGNANIFIDNVSSAQQYLKKSSSSSRVNLGITKAIKKALNFKIRTANKELQKLVKLQPKHSILQYDLGLTYAQMGDMPNAYKHFIRSYHLDAKNYLSGIFALMTAELINKDTTKLQSIIKDSISKEDDNEETELYKTLIAIKTNDYLAAIDWLDNTYEQKPLYLAIDTIIALKLNRLDVAKKVSRKLTVLLPNDILPHILYIDAHYDTLDNIEYAKQVTAYLKKQHFHLNDLYFGPYITRFCYIQEELLTGQLYFLRQKLKTVLETTSHYKEDIVLTLALASFYGGAFEESYTLYNQIVDQFKIRDAKTLFLAGVASTAAKHHANAIALFELSKMKNPNFYESRYALGLLYLEINNNNGATIQFSKILKNQFLSDYFDFDIDTNRLLIEKTTKNNL